MKTLLQYCLLAGMIFLLTVTAVTAVTGEPVTDVMGRTGGDYGPVPGTREHGVTSQFIRDSGRDHLIIDFEGIGNHVPVGTITGLVDVTFGWTWLAVLDSDVGGFGAFANEPSPDAAADGTLDSPHAPINFSAGVAGVFFYYSAGLDALPLTLEAYDDLDGSGNLVDTSTVNTLGNSAQGASCTGDPTGQFCKWDRIGVFSSVPNIRSVVFPNASSIWYLVDDMWIFLNYENEVPATDTTGIIILLLVISVGIYMSTKR